MTFFTQFKPLCVIAVIIISDEFTIDRLSLGDRFKLIWFVWFSTQQFAVNWWNSLGCVTKVVQSLWSCGLCKYLFVAYFLIVTFLLFRYVSNLTNSYCNETMVSNMGAVIATTRAYLCNCHPRIATYECVCNA